jgi:hypothetical protein
MGESLTRRLNVALDSETLDMIRGLAQATGHVTRSGRMAGQPNISAFLREFAAMLGAGLNEAALLPFLNWEGRSPMAVTLAQLDAADAFLDKLETLGQQKLDAARARVRSEREEMRAKQAL